MWFLVAAALGAPCALTGTVTSPDGALAGQSVELAREVKYEVVEQQTVSTGADGRFATTLGEGTWIVSASRPEWVPGTTERVRCNAQAVEVSLTLAAGDVVVRGKLADTAGRPVGGRVSIVQAGGTEVLAGPAFLDVDARGEFETRVVGGKQYVLYGMAEGYRFASETLMFDHDKGARTSDVRLVLRELAKVHGTVVDRSGQPVADARMLLGPTGTLAATFERSGADGTFTVAVDAGVSYSLSATHSGGVACLQNQRSLSEGQGAGPVTVTLGVGRTLTGDVRDRAGHPVAGAEMFWTHGPCGLFGTTLSGADGTFSLSAVLDEPVELFVPKQSNPTRVLVERLQTTVHLTVDAD
ncbi:MAG: hypothetical protein ACI9K2_007576 [Myxococcota bacterium]|jgi:hypothetical protein